MIVSFEGEKESFKLLALACGFKFDFSEDNELTDELFDNPLPAETKAVPPLSEVDTTELWVQELADCAFLLTFPWPSGISEDNPLISEGSFLVSCDIQVAIQKIKIKINKESHL